MNKISATGRLAADAEVKFTANNDPILNFRLASDIGYGDKKTTNWFHCSLFGKRGESVAPYLAKGTQVAVFGSLVLREWTNKEGIKQISPDIRIDEVSLMGEKKADTQEPQQRTAPAKPRPSASAMESFTDDVPW